MKRKVDDASGELKEMKELVKKISKLYEGGDIDKIKELLNSREEKSKDE